MAAAARRYGVELVPAAQTHDGVISFDLVGGGSLAVTTVAAPLPGAASRPVGPTSAPPAEVAEAAAHLIVAAFGLTGPARDRDTRMAQLTAAVIDTVDAIGALLGHGVLIQRAALFAEAARLAADTGQPLAAEVAVDVTAAAESATRMSFLTHGLRRYGREELYVTCPIEGTGALAFVLSLAGWLLAEPDTRLATGDTVGRTADEKIVVQRVPDPVGGDGEVIRLDLP